MLLTRRLDKEYDRSSDSAKRAIFRPSFELLEARVLLATNIYIATTGSDASGSGAISNPYATLGRGLSAANPGDTIILRGGTYAGGVVVDEPRITIRSYTGEWAKITAPINDPDIDTVIRFNPDASGGKIQRLELVGGYYYALMFHSTWDWGPPTPQYGASNIIVEDSKLHDSGRDVIKITPGSDNITIRRNEIYNSGRRDPSNAEGIDNTNGDHMIVQDNYIHDIATNGMYAKGGAIGAVIERNLLMNLGGGGIMVGFYTDAEWFDTARNPDYYENIDGTVRNNIIVDATYAGIGLYAALRPKIYNNTLVRVAQAGQAGILFAPSEIYFGSDPDPLIVPNKDVTIINNIVTLSASSGQPAVQIRENGLIGTLTMSNNRYFDASGAAEFSDGRSGNTFNGSLSQWKAHIASDGGSSEGNPQLNSHYHLASSSPCINAGMTIGSVTNDYDGNPRSGPYDIGADEFAAGPALAVPPSAGTIGTGQGGGNAPQSPVRPVVFDVTGNRWLMRNSLTSGPAEITFTFGIAGDIPVMGDWNGDGVATPGVYRNGRFFLRNSLSGGSADLSFTFGRPGDVPVAGDWNGDGRDTIGVRRGGRWFLRNANASGPAHFSFTFGLANDIAVVGDWNGDGLDTIGVRRGDTWLLSNTNRSGFAQISLIYGLASDKPVVGDWDNDGDDTVGIYRRGAWYLRNVNTSGFADMLFNFGETENVPLVSAS